MTPKAIQIIQILALTLSTSAVVATFFVYLGQFRVMHDQLHLMRESTAEQIRAMQAQLEAARNVYRAQNLIALNQVVTEPTFRQARKTLINLKGKPLSAWSQEERHLAERACGLWNFVAQLVLELDVPPRVVGSMKYTVTACHDAAAELLAKLRSTRMPNQWEHFTMLANQFGSECKSET